MFWFLLVVYFIGLLIFVGLLQVFNEDSKNTAIALAVVVLGIALLLFGAHLWYAFYTLMLLPWFTFLPAIPELDFWGIYIAYAFLRGGVSVKSK